MECKVCKKKEIFCNCKPKQQKFDESISIGNYLINERGYKQVRIDDYKFTYDPSEMTKEEAYTKLRSTI